MIRFYGTLGIGIAYRNEIDTYDSVFYLSKFANGVNNLGNSRVINNSKYFVNYYLSFLGIHFGRKLGGFFETGLGYKGIINIGLSYKYN